MMWGCLVLIPECCDEGFLQALAQTPQGKKFLAAVYICHIHVSCFILEKNCYTYRRK
jgi:hypothetical protein